MSALTDKLTKLISDNVKETDFSKAVEVLHGVLDLERVAEDRGKVIEFARHIDYVQKARIAELEAALREADGKADEQERYWMQRGRMTVFEEARNLLSNPETASALRNVEMAIRAHGAEGATDTVKKGTHT